MKKLYILILCALFLISAASCNKKEKQSVEDEQSSNIVIQESAKPDFPVSIRGVSIEQTPTKIVSFSPAITEIMAELGLHKNLVGRTEYCEYSSVDYIAKLPSVGTAVVPDMPQLLALMPEYIITQSPISESLNETLSGMGTKVIIIPKAKNIIEVTDIYKDLFMLCQGGTTGEQAANAFNEEFINQFTQVMSTIPVVEESSKLNGVYLSSEFNAATPDTFESYLLGAMRLVNVAQGENWLITNKDINPDIIIVPISSDINELQKTSIYSESDAVDNDNIKSVNHVPIERQSPRMIIELKGLIASIYS